MTSSTQHIGTWLSLGSPAVAELATLCGFDWVLLDLEHGSESEAALPNQLRALRGGQTQGIVRVGAPHADLIARVLDWGAQGIMVPHVNTASEAEAIVQAACYAPRGRRGYSRTVRAYDYGLQSASAEAFKPIIMAQIETVEGVKNAASIAAVDGIDVLFVGPADLQFDLTHGRDNTANDFAQCLVQVVHAAKTQAKSAGILIRDLSDLQRHSDIGFNCIAIDSDIAIIRKAYQATLAQVAGHTHE